MFHSSLVVLSDTVCPEIVLCYFSFGEEENRYLSHLVECLEVRREVPRSVRLSWEPPFVSYLKDRSNRRQEGTKRQLRRVTGIKGPLISNVHGNGMSSPRVHDFSHLFDPSVDFYGCLPRTVSLIL